MAVHTHAEKKEQTVKISVKFHRQDSNSGPPDVQESNTLPPHLRVGFRRRKTYLIIDTTTVCGFFYKKIC